MADKVLCEKNDLVAVANAIRSKNGTTNTYKVNQLASAVENISSGTTLPSLSNPGSAADLRSGKELIDQSGNKITGTLATVTQATPSITVNSAGLITASATQTAGYVTSGTKSATKQLTTKSAATITPGTSNQTIAAGSYLTGAQTIKGDSNLVAGNIKSGVSIFGVSGSYVGSGSGSATENKFLQRVDGSLTTVTAEDLQGVTSISNGAFQNCDNLTSIVIPNSVTSIGEHAFNNCDNLTSITIPNSITRIGTNVFYFCISLTGITIPNSVTSIGDGAFGFCRSLTSITIPDSVTSIGTNMCYSCISLESITLPNSITSIKSSAFYNCSSLTSVTIGNGVTSIGTSALQIGSSTNKATITMISTTPPTITTSTFNTSYLNKIIVPKGTGSTYKSATNWSAFASYIREAT